MPNAKIEFIVRDRDGREHPATSEQSAKKLAQKGDSWGIRVNGKYIGLSRNYSKEWARRKELGTALNGADYARMRKASATLSLS